MLRVCDGQGWRCLLSSGNCGSVFPRALVNSTATVSATFLLAVQQRESPGTALLPRPPGLLWHCWARGGFVWSFVCSTSVSSCAPGWVRTWPGGLSSSHCLRAAFGSCRDLMWPPVQTASSTGNLWLENPEFLLLQKHWAVILTCTVTAKPLLLWLFQRHVWYFEVFWYNK